MSVEYDQTVRLMGKCVVVVEHLERQISDDKMVTWLSLPVTPRAGWVTGIRNKQQGELVAGTHYAVGWDADAYDPPTFRQCSTVLALLVVYWPTMNPVLVPFDGFRIASVADKPHPPGYKWSERDREDMREIAKELPRDSRGRFKKESA